MKNFEDDPNDDDCDDHAVVSDGAEEECDDCDQEQLKKLFDQDENEEKNKAERFY